jgi:hypothetical protein
MIRNKLGENKGHENRQLNSLREVLKASSTDLQQEPLQETQEMTVNKPEQQKIYAWEEAAPKSMKSKLMTLNTFLGIILFLCATNTAAAVQSGNKPRGPMICQMQQGGVVWKLPEFDCGFKQLSHKTATMALRLDIYTPNVIEYDTEAYVCRRVKKKV